MLPNLQKILKSVGGGVGSSFFTWIQLIKVPCESELK